MSLLALGERSATAMQNLNAMTIDSEFIVPANFYNAGDLYLVTGGSITGNLLGGRSLQIGINPVQSLQPVDFRSAANISGVGTIETHPGSSLTSVHEISGVTTGFIVRGGAKADLHKSLLGAGLFLNEGQVQLHDQSQIHMLSVSNRGHMSTSGRVVNNSKYANEGTLDVRGDLQGYGSIFNASTGKLNFLVHAINSNAICNHGTIDFVGDVTNSAAIENAKLMNVGGKIAGNGTITNASKGVINLNQGGFIQNRIENYGRLNLNGGNFAGLNNSGETYVGTRSQLSGDIVNTGTIILKNSIDMPGQKIINQGVVQVNGVHTIVADKLISHNGCLKFHIYDENKNDQLNVSQTLDLTNGGVISVDTQFFGQSGSSYTWQLLSAPDLLIDDTTKVVAPQSFINKWDITTGTDYLTISSSTAQFADLAKGQDNIIIARALDKLSTETLDVTPLLSSIAASESQEIYDASLLKLMPTQYTSYHNATLQKVALNKVEFRMSNLRDSIPHIPAAGVAFGDITPDIALWASSFGSLADQQPYSKSYGYYAKSLGGLIGIDKFTEAGSIFGFALGVSNSNLYENNEHATTRLLGYHGIFYGSTDLSTESYFMEWLLTGVINKNKTTRNVVINNTNFGVNSSYRTSLGGMRINFGQSTENDTWQFSLIETVSYALLYQPSYNEHNSSAALHVTPRQWSNILTVGGGLRFALMEDKSWLRGDREIRFMGTYDAISTIQETTASFINSTSGFTLYSAPGRWSFQTGATYTFSYFDCLQVQFSYDFELRTKYTDNTLEIKLRILI